MAYEHIPDHEKKKLGRPRKVISEIEQQPKKSKYKPKARNKKQTAQELRGVPVIQLDYNTGEYVDEYPSLAAVAEDYDIPLTNITGLFAKKSEYCVMGRLPKYKLLLIRKEAFINMIKGVIFDEYK